MGTQSKANANCPNKDRWENLLKRANVSAGFAHQIARNLALATHQGTIREAGRQVINTMVPFSETIPANRKQCIFTRILRRIPFLRGR